VGGAQRVGIGWERGFAVHPSDELHVAELADEFFERARALPAGP
jgi:hypothetical protein